MSGAFQNNSDASGMVRELVFRRSVNEICVILRFYAS